MFRRSSVAVATSREDHRSRLPGLADRRPPRDPEGRGHAGYRPGTDRRCWIALGEIYASLALRTHKRLALRTHKRPIRRLPREDFALNRSAKRRLCNTVGGRFIEGASRWYAASTARSRAVATTNLARSNHSLLLRALFGGTKRSTLVNIFMICPPMADWWLPTRIKFCL
jgi:hypothetical protein